MFHRQTSGLRYVGSIAYAARSNPGIAGIFALSAFGPMLILYATVWGPWAFSDATEYLVAARNLLGGTGLGLFNPSGEFQPLSIHPPLFPVALAGLGALGPDLVQAARWLNAILFGVTICLVGGLISRVSKSDAFGIAASGLFLISPTLVDLYSGAMSEPIFFAVGTAGLVTILIFLRTQRWSTLALASVFFALSFLARYSGVAFIVAGAAVLIANRPLIARTSFLHVATLAVISSMPGLVWLLSRGSAFALEPTFAGEWYSDAWTRLSSFRIALVEIVWGWLPYPVAIFEISYRAKLLGLTGLAVAAMVFTFVAGTRLVRAERPNIGSQQNLALCISLIAFIPAYLLVLAISKLAIGIPVNERILSPLLLAALLLFFGLIGLMHRSIGKTGWLVVFTVVWCSGMALRGVPITHELVSELHEEGRGYTSRKWTQSGVIEGIGTLPQQMPLISNESSAVLFHSNRAALDLPEWRSLTCDESLQAIDKCLECWLNMANAKAAVVIFESYHWEVWEACRDRTESSILELKSRMVLHSNHWDGEIYIVGTEQ